MSLSDDLLQRAEAFADTEELNQFVSSIWHDPELALRFEERPREMLAELGIKVPKGLDVAPLGTGWRKAGAGLHPVRDPLQSVPDHRRARSQDGATRSASASRSCRRRCRAARHCPAPAARRWTQKMPSRMAFGTSPESCSRRLKRMPERPRSRRLPANRGGVHQEFAWTAVADVGGDSWPSRLAIRSLVAGPAPDVPARCWRHGTADGREPWPIVERSPCPKRRGAGRARTGHVHAGGCRLG